jgi:hypothetical protein
VQELSGGLTSSGLGMAAGVTFAEIIRAANRHAELGSEAKQHLLRRIAQAFRTFPSEDTEYWASLCEMTSQVAYLGKRTDEQVNKVLLGAAGALKSTEEGQ